MQQPSSLIFLVIIAVWAVYFVQHWVRRREHLATARSVDQFSESLRVLERRTPLPASDLSTPVRPSYAVSPARAARPQVLVKRAETAPLSSSASTSSGSSSGSLRVEATGDRMSASRPVSVSPPRKVRGLVFLASLGTVPVLGVCAVLGVVSAWSLLAPLVAVGASVAWLRAAVTAERAARVAARPPVRRAAPARATAAAHAGPAERVERVERAEPAEHAGSRESDQADADLTTTPAPQELYDGAAVEVGARTAAPAGQPRPLVDEDDIPLTWEPVPVPPPTYTMKARVTRPAPTSADLVGDADTEYAPRAEEPVRRVAGA